MGVTPRGVDYNDWEENITTVASRKLLTEENEEERVRTDKEERKSQDSDLIQTATHSTEKHPVWRRGGKADSKPAFYRMFVFYLVYSCIRS